MQRVVRFTFAALTLAGLAACGDKVNVTQQAIDSTALKTRRVMSTFRSARP